jgi:hypothetical protein
MQLQIKYYNTVLTTLVSTGGYKFIRKRTAYLFTDGSMVFSG